MSESFIKKRFLNNTINDNLLELTVPRKDIGLYVKVLRELLKLPYYKVMYSEAYVRERFQELCQLNMEVIKNAKGIIFKYEDWHYKINRITDYFSEEARLNGHILHKKSPFEVFHSDAFFVDLLHDCRRISSEIIREYLWKKSKECTLFKATLTVGMYRFLNAKRVLDISAGWGDRLLGALAAGVDEYLAYDPNLALKEGHDAIKAMFDKNKVSKIIYEPFEDGVIPESHFDCVFSSPPFFNYETYSSSGNQSILRYPEYNAWLTNFLFKSLEKAWRSLVVGGNLVMYINDVPGCSIVGPMLRYLDRLPGSKRMVNLYTKGDARKLRPMYWYRK